MPDTDCIFCKVAAGEIPSNTVYKDEHVTAFRDLNPQAPTHVLVIPNTHVPDVSGLADAQLSLEMLRACATVAEQEGLRSGYRIVTNSGPDAGQTVQHLHWHVLGGRKLGWPPG